MNIVHNCLDKWLATELADSPALRWEFEEGGYRGGGGLFTGLFGGNGYRDAGRLVKGSASMPVRLPGDTGRYGNDLRFLGWVVE